MLQNRLETADALRQVASKVRRTEGAQLAEIVAIKIYVAVPDPELNKAIRSRLEPEGHRIQEAMDFGLVPEEVGLFGADLVLMSNRLPDVPTDQIISMLRSDPMTEDRPVLMMVQGAVGDTRARARRHGADDMVPLPLRGTDLVDRVNRLAEGRNFPQVSVDASLPDLSDFVGSMLEDLSELDVQIDVDGSMDADDSDAVVTVATLAPTGATSRSELRHVGRSAKGSGKGSGKGSAKGSGKGSRKGSGKGASAPGAEVGPSPSPSVAHIGQGLPTGIDGFYEHDMAVLIEVSEAMASSLPTADALFVLVRRISQVIPVDRCNVLLRSAKHDEAFVLASHDDANLHRRPVDLGRYPEVRRCLDSGETVLIEDVLKDPEMQQVLDFITAVNLRSVLVLPLFVREVAVGTLSLTTRREVHGFTRRELLFLRAMANMAAGTLSTSEIMEEVRRLAAAEKPPMEEFDEVILDIDDQIEGLIEELDR